MLLNYFAPVGGILLFLCTSFEYVDSGCTRDSCGINTSCSELENGALQCRCKSGFDHARGSNSIEGCPERLNTPLGGSTPFRTRNYDNRDFERQSFQSSFNDLSEVLSDNGFDPCLRNPCGLNAECTVKQNRAVCSCKDGSYGTPTERCVFDPCASKYCGPNSNCIPRGKDAYCVCDEGYLQSSSNGQCEDPCDPSPCDRNAVCNVVGGRAQCECRGGYKGDGRTCSLNPCDIVQCGINAFCTNRNNQAFCQCDEGYSGDAENRCELDPCYGDICGPNALCEPSGSSARCKCRQGFVKRRDGYGCEFDPCSNDYCGKNALCQASGNTAVCSCPTDYVGNPKTECFFDACANTPCGPGAICKSRKGESDYECECPSDHIGDPYTAGCEYDPCTTNPCGPNADCEVRGTQRYCTCFRGYFGSPDSRSGCRINPCENGDACGANALCENFSGRPTCSCPRGYVGDPNDECIQGECVMNSQCAENQECKNNICVDPCRNSCGRGAECYVRRHIAICHCPAGFDGDPFELCRKLSREEICSVCGDNTDCEVDEFDKPICSCKRNYIGNALSGCEAECESDSQCSDDQICDQLRCKPVCDQDSCGNGAICEARNHQPRCSCPENQIGEPEVSCRPECLSHDECDISEACIKSKCEDPCLLPDICGLNAECNVKNHKPICSCPKGSTGHPYKSCREFTREDVCSPNPCGIDALCFPVSDVGGNPSYICNCPVGFIKGADDECKRGECERDRDCRRHDDVCIDSECVDACEDSCGIGRKCVVKNKERSDHAIIECSNDDSELRRSGINSGSGGYNRQRFFTSSRRRNQPYNS